MAWNESKEREYQELLAKYPELNEPENRNSGDYINNLIGSVSGAFPFEAGRKPIEQTALGVSDALRNMGAAVKSTVSGGEYEPIKSGEGAPYSLGHFTGNMLPFVKGAHVATMPARLGTALTSGYLLNPNENVEGAKESLAWQAGAEAIPYVGKGARFGLDKLVRKDFAQDIMKDLSKHYQSSKETALGYLNPLLEKYGTKNIYKKGQNNIAKSFDENSDWLGPDTKKLYKRFQEEPNLKNAQDFQSSLGGDMRAMQDKDPHKYQAAKDLREQTLDAMEVFFNAKDPKAVDEWKEFRRVWREDVAPHESNKILHDITEGKTSKITPKKLEGALVEASEGYRPAAGEAHPISVKGNELQEKLRRSQLYQTGLGALGGALIGGPAGFGLGAAFGAGTSPLLRMLGGDLSNVLLNEELTKLLKQSYPGLQKAVIAEKAAPEIPGE